MAIKFSKETFSRLDLADLLLNVHSYAHTTATPSEIEKQYAKWCGELVAESWSLRYMDYSFVIKTIFYQNKNIIDLGKVPSCDKHLIYEAIRK